MGSTGARSESQPRNEPNAITVQATLRSQVPLPDRNVAMMGVEPSVEITDGSERGFSPLVVAEQPLHVKENIEHAELLGYSDLRSKKSIWQNSPLSRQTDKAKGTHRSLSVPSHMKPRQQLRLPSFKSLGLSPLYPEALLTPPDEASLIHWTPSPLGTSDLPTSQSTSQLTGTLSQATMPEAPVFSGSIADGNSNAPTSAPAAPLIAVHNGEKADEGSASSSDEASETPNWIDLITQAIGKLHLHGWSSDALLTPTSVCCCVG